MFKSENPTVHIKSKTPVKGFSDAFKVNFDGQEVLPK